MKYKKGTQEMLDAAKDDATLLPYGVTFKTNGKSNGRAIVAPIGLVVCRSSEGHNDAESVRVTDREGSVFYVSASCLEPIKKSKTKKWQNGTQAQLDAAKDDARLIPKKTFFRFQGWFVHRGTSPADSIERVLMIAFGSSSVHFSKMLSAGDLNV